MGSSLLCIHTYIDTIEVHTHTHIYIYIYDWNVYKLIYILLKCIYTHINKIKIYIYWPIH